MDGQASTEATGKVDLWLFDAFGVDPRTYPAKSISNIPGTDSSGSASAGSSDASGSAVALVADADDDDDEDIFADLKDAISLAGELITDVKDLMVYIAKWSEGCRIPIAAAIVAGGTTVTAIAAAVALSPADATPAAPAAALGQVAAIATAALTGMGFLVSIAAVVDCKETNLENAKKEGRTQSEIESLQKQVKEIQAGKDKTHATVTKIRAISHKKKSAA